MLAVLVQIPFGELRVLAAKAAGIKPSSRKLLYQQKRNLNGSNQKRMTQNQKRTEIFFHSVGRIKVQRGGN